MCSAPCQSRIKIRPLPKRPSAIASLVFAMAFSTASRARRQRRRGGDGVRQELPRARRRHDPPLRRHQVGLGEELQRGHMGRLREGRRLGPGRHGQGARARRVLAAPVRRAVEEVRGRLGARRHAPGRDRGHLRLQAGPARQARARGLRGVPRGARGRREDLRGLLGARRQGLPDRRREGGRDAAADTPEVPLSDSARRKRLGRVGARPGGPKASRGRGQAHDGRRRGAQGVGHTREPVTRC